MSVPPVVVCGPGPFPPPPGPPIEECPPTEAVIAIPASTQVLTNVAAVVDMDTVQVQIPPTMANLSMDAIIAGVFGCYRIEGFICLFGPNAEPITIDILVNTMPLGPPFQATLQVDPLAAAPTCVQVTGFSTLDIGDVVQLQAVISEGVISITSAWLSVERISCEPCVAAGG